MTPMPGQLPLPTPDASPCASCERLDRRHFLSAASVLSLGAFVSACGDGVIGGPESVPAFPDALFTVDPRQVTALQSVGGRTVVQQGAAAPVLVERVSAGQFRAWSLACPHRGTIVTVERSGFRCPNHGAVFDADGRWLSGQPTSDLAPVGVRVNADGTLSVGGQPLPPALALGTTSLVFTAITTSATEPAAQTVAVSNAGGGALSPLTATVSYTGNQTGWLSVSLSAAAAPATLTVTARRGTLPAGTYNATVSVNAPGNSAGVRSIAVVLIVQSATAPAALVLSSTTAAISLPLGSQSDVQVVQVRNAGGGAITGLSTQTAYSAGNVGWLAVSLNATSTPAVLTVRATATGLSAGNYTAQVTVSAPGVAAQFLTVTLTVAPNGLVVNIAAWPALANVGGVAGSVGNLNTTPVAVVRTSATSFAAFSMICPHAGTRIDVVNNTSFRCPNHGALFDSAGVNLPSSPQRTDNLNRLVVTYTPGASTLLVS
jgi:Rieske Fe-S protein